MAIYLIAVSDFHCGPKHQNKCVIDQSSDRNDHSMSFAASVATYISQNDQLHTHKKDQHLGERKLQLLMDALLLIVSNSRTMSLQ